MTPAPPKLLNLTTPTVRNQRTLIWLQNQNTTVNWSKWDGIVTSLSSFFHWSNHDAKIVGMIITDYPEQTDTFLETLYEVSKVLPMILVSQKVLSLKSEAYWTENFDNLISLDTMMDTYPFMEIPWDGTPEDAIAMFALLCRYNRVVDCKISKPRSHIIGTNMSFSFNIQPNQVWVFTQFFRHKNNRRFKEIKDCLMKNCECPHIDKIVVLNEKNYSNEWKYFPGSDKVQQVITGKRLTYADFLQYVHDQVPDDVYVILCNADIYFGDSLRDLYKIDMKNRMLALLRWDVDTSDNAKLFGPRSDSQDSWIFLSNSIRSKNWDYSKFLIHLGHPGCDNTFAGQILRNHFVISNPSVTFKTFHLHNTNIRNYDLKDAVPADVYVNIVPSNIIDTKQEKEPNLPPVTLNNDLVQFDIKSSSMSNEITYCTMLEKAGRYNWEPSTQNFYFEAAIPVYTWKKAAVTPNGLVYDLYHIYKGTHCDNPQYNYWMSSSTEIFTPMQSRKKMLAIPFKDTSVFKHADTYLLNYVSKCKRLLGLHPDASFWLPNEFRSTLEALDWKIDDASPVPFDEYSATWADDVVGFLPGPESGELGKEDIDTLRSMLPSWKAVPTPYVCAFILDDTITEAFVKQSIIPSLLEKSSKWIIRYVYSSDVASYDVLQGVSLCVFVGGEQTATKWSKLWALPKDCCVVEFQQELQIDGEFQHLAHVAEFKSWALLLSKGSAEDVQDQIQSQFGKWLKKNYDEYFA
jgi:hypothetical protein